MMMMMMMIVVVLVYTTSEIPTLKALQIEHLHDRTFRSQNESIDWIPNAVLLFHPNILVFPIDKVIVRHVHLDDIGEKKKEKSVIDVVLGFSREKKKKKRITSLWSFSQR